MFFYPSAMVDSEHNYYTVQAINECKHSERLVKK